MNSDYSYEYEYDSFYCYPNSFILKNKLNITDEKELKQAEREITSLRTAQALVERIDGKFDFEHLKEIHRFLFGDIYDWAGMVRNVNIAKGNQFCRFDFIEEQMEELLSNLKKENYLLDCKVKFDLAKRLAYYLGEINAIHPFREGNGRSQRMFIEYLSFHVGYQFDFMKITSQEMLEASVNAFNLNYTMMEQLINRALTKL
ncbi:Fic/DOC family protein [Clostridium frigidicarnis]|uniref:protein adenylyltransferase n=1 Tax=Clostridium frigidicarnis TaxID=84698 RepID=A0A1I1AYH5_9CLOT|nr:Fic family protein [Clostridium frigidicarnis]SFB41420.1 cell filamentation protein [Clostridium frigidicarnis]